MTPFVHQSLASNLAIRNEEGPVDWLDQTQQKSASAQDPDFRHAKAVNCDRIMRFTREILPVLRCALQTKHISLLEIDALHVLHNLKT